jgi:hypothetical protein
VGAGFARKGKGLRPFSLRAARLAGPMPSASKDGPQKNKTLRQMPLWRRIFSKGVVKSDDNRIPEIKEKNGKPLSFFLKSMYFP